MNTILSLPISVIRLASGLAFSGNQDARLARAK
jgi:hypothetical protein